MTVNSEKVKSWLFGGAGVIRVLPQVSVVKSWALQQFLNETIRNLNLQNLATVTIKKKGDSPLDCPLFDGSPFYPKRLSFLLFKKMGSVKSIQLILSEVRNIDLFRFGVKIHPSRRFHLYPGPSDDVRRSDIAIVTILPDANEAG